MIKETLTLTKELLYRDMPWQVESLISSSTDAEQATCGSISKIPKRVNNVQN